MTSSGYIELLPCYTRVKKYIVKDMEKFWRDIQRLELQREIDTYTHLPPHPRLVPVLDSNNAGDDSSLTLEYMSEGNLTAYLKNNAAALTTELRARWALQTAQALAMLHAHNVIHANLTGSNLLLDRSLNLYMISFKGCSLLGKPPYHLESGGFFLPAERRRGGELWCDETTDLFALGSTIYQIATGEKPYEGLGEEDVERNFAEGTLPELERVLFGRVIRKCWDYEFESEAAVLHALGTEAEDLLGDSEFVSRALR